MRKYVDNMVSIVMPSYNTGKYIKQSIESVLNQSYKNWELLIVDDCSTDNTHDVLKEFCDERIRVIVNDINSGAAISRNKAINEAKGEWIAFLDSDDLWTEEKLEKQIKFMKENKYSFSCAYSIYIDEDSNHLNKLDTCPMKITRKDMFLYNWIACLTAMYHVPTVGLIQIENIAKRNDYAMWLQITKKTECHCFPEVLGLYRVRKNSMSHTNVKKLVLAHYQMFRICEQKSVIQSVIFTFINIVMSFYRKKKYVKELK